MSKRYQITGKTIDGNFQGVARQSCKPIDSATAERIEITIDGETYERTVFERIIWRAMKPNTLVARFVIVNGTQYEVTEVDEPVDE